MNGDDGQPPISFEQAANYSTDIISELSDAIIATNDFLQTVLTGVIAGEHMLLEDVPGTGKTLTARSLATTLGLDFNRIQFTPDLLPGDITGSEIFDDHSDSFRFNEGPIFSNIVLADEINRAPPKTQAALLEAMEEHQVSVGGVTRSLPEPFFVIATQNPIEHEGTFELPTAQRDRFMVKSEIGYPDRANEQRLLDRRTSRHASTPTVEQAIDPETLDHLQEMPEYVYVDDSIRDYIVDLGRTTRTHSATEVGVSPRGIQRHLEASRARAVLQGRDFVAPDDVKSMAIPVLAHRIVLTSAASVEGTDRIAVIEDVLQSIDVPAMAEPVDQTG